MKSGQDVRVLDYKGQKLVRRVVEVIGEVVLVCKPDEYDVAKERRCLPWCVGFRRQFVSEIK